MSKAKNKIGFGVIGLGNIAGHHIKCIDSLNNGELVAACTSDPSKGVSLQKEHPDVNIYNDLPAMLADDAVDVVVICTPSGFHMESTIAAAEAGKHVIVEKPIDVTMERATAMVNVCKKNNVLFSCIFQNRYSKDYKKLKSKVTNGELGNLVLGNAYIKWYRDNDYYKASQWRGTIKGDGGAALINQSIHTIDLLVDVMGPVKSVIGRTATRTHNIEGEDIGVAILEFANGALGTIEGSTTIKPGYPERLEVHGSENSFVLEQGKLLGDQENTEQAAASGASNPMDIGFELHLEQYGNIVDSIINNTKPDITGESALTALEVVLAIYESSKTRETINLKPR